MVQDKTPPPNEVGLDLSRAADPADVVRIGGVSYDLVRMSELSLRARARVRWLLERLQKLEAIPDGTATADDDAEYVQRHQEVARIALPGVPAEVWATVNEEGSQKIAAHFFLRAELRSPLMTQLIAIAKEGRVPANSLTDLLGSNGSTAATPSGGST